MVIRKSIRLLLKFCRDPETSGERGKIKEDVACLAQNKHNGPT
jgi:hypothetical protein